MAKQDPRYLNQVFDTSSITRYFDDYKKAVNAALAEIDSAELEKGLELVLKAVQSGKHVFSAGNGGSATIADQLGTDWTKGTFVAGKPVLRTRSLVANNSLLTAFGNDFGYDEVFSRQLDLFAHKGDVLVLISSSGNSPNVVRAAEKAKALGVSVIGFTGFAGGKLKDLSDAKLHVPIANYGVVEDCHQALMHCFCQYIGNWMDQSAPQVTT